MDKSLYRHGQILHHALKTVLYFSARFYSIFEVLLSFLAVCILSSRRRQQGWLVILPGLGEDVKVGNRPCYLCTTSSCCSDFQRMSASFCLLDVFESSLINWRSARSSPFSVQPITFFFSQYVIDLLSKTGLLKVTCDSFNRKNTPLKLRWLPYFYWLTRFLYLFISSASWQRLLGIPLISLQSVSIGEEFKYVIQGSVPRVSEQMFII